MVLYIDGGRVSSSTFRGIAALGAVMFEKYVCKIKAYCNWIKQIKSVELRTWGPVNMVLIPPRWSYCHVVRIYLVNP